MTSVSPTLCHVLLRFLKTRHRLHQRHLNGPWRASRGTVMRRCCLHKMMMTLMVVVTTSSQRVPDERHWKFPWYATDWNNHVVVWWGIWKWVVPVSPWLPQLLLSVPATTAKASWRWWDGEPVRRQQPSFCPQRTLEGERVRSSRYSGRGPRR